MDLILISFEFVKDTQRSFNGNQRLFFETMKQNLKKKAFLLN